MKKNTLFLHTGSNLGNRIANIQVANFYIKKEIGSIEKYTQYYQTKAWGITEQPDFINQALQVSTNLSPFEVLEKIQLIETTMGRIRLQKWSERLIDIDILFYDDQIINSKNLTIPHPFLQERNFVLVPLQEIAATWQHPIFEQTISELLKTTKDNLKVIPFP